MAKKAGSGKPPGRGNGKPGSGAGRRARGFTPAGNLIRPQMRTAAAKRGFVQARLHALWPQIAGPELASVCAPVKLTSARGPSGGLLRLAVSGAHAPQVQMMIPTLCERINAAMGPGTVGRIQLAHAAPGDLITQPKPPPQPSTPPPELDARMEEQLSSIGDEKLRSALQTLAQNVLSRARNKQKPEH